MSYAIFRTQKMQSNVIEKCQKHNQRENKYYSNEDIDLFRTRFNYDLHNNKKINYKTEIEKKIKERYKGKKNIRKDAVVNIECVITSDDKFFKSIGESETKRYFEESYKFVSNHFGTDNIVYATVHLDETTPHMHLGVSPITKDGRLCAKDWLDGKKKLKELQDSFHSYVTSKGFNLERGISSEETQARNINKQKYKKQLTKDLGEINKELEEKKAMYLEINKHLHKNHMNLIDIDKIECEDIITLFSKDLENVKVKRNDFEELKILARKSVEQQNLYRLSKDEIEELRRANKSLREEKDYYYNKCNSIKREYSNELSKKVRDIKKYNFELFDEIKLRDVMLLDCMSFIDEIGMSEDFYVYREELINKRQKEAQKTRRRSIENNKTVSKEYSGLEI